MIWGSSWIIITLVAVITDFIIGEFPVKHPVEYIGDFIKDFENYFYKKSIIRGFVLLAILVFIVFLITVIIQLTLMTLSQDLKYPEIISYIILGVLASTGLASKTLKNYIKNVIYADYDHKRANLSLLVTRNTELLSDKKVYSSLIETYAENFSDGIIAPLFYLILFGFPGIMVFKTVSTLDSMVGYKNDKYEKFGKASALFDDVLNFIPARITAFIIWTFSKEKNMWKKILKDAKLYSTSPNAGYPVAAAAYKLGVVLGGPVYYGDLLVNKSEVGIDNTENYEDAVMDFMKFHNNIEILIVCLLIITLMLIIITNGNSYIIGLIN